MPTENGPTPAARVSFVFQSNTWYFTDEDAQFRVSYARTAFDFVPYIRVSA